MKKYNSIFWQIFFSILLTSLIVISVNSILSGQRINRGFNKIIKTQEDLVEGPSRFSHLTKEQKAVQHQKLVKNIKQTTTKALLVSSLIGGTLAMIISFLLSNYISHPLKILQRHLNQLSKKKYMEIKYRSGINEIDSLINEFNLMVQKLYKIDQLREDLLSDVTHELKTPLTKIIGLLEGCLDNVYECNNKHIELTLKEVYQLSNIIQDLQRINQMQAEKINLNIEKFDLHEFVENIFNTYKNKIGKNIKFINAVPAQTIISADVSKLQEIFDNLISNAIRYTSQGYIKIAFQNNKILIEDTGVGIDKKHQPHIFERFYRVNKARDRKSGGVGLGLAITKDLVRLHKWEIKVKSAKNKGTTFIIQLKP